jgi:hypothetical protein
MTGGAADFAGSCEYDYEILFSLKRKEFLD